jgi:hypothetical protein
VPTAAAIVHVDISNTARAKPFPALGASLVRTARDLSALGEALGAAMAVRRITEIMPSNMA